MTLRPCLTCGVPTTGPRCNDHTTDPKPTAHARGYDHTWTKLSKRARKLQPFCTDCGATDDLQTDHSPEAWERRAAGKPIRLTDIDVVCGPCNRTRGTTRPQQTPHHNQQTPPNPPTRGHTPPTPHQDPRPQARSALHTGVGAAALRPANSRLGTAKVVE